MTRITLTLLALPALSVAATVNLNVQVVVSGNLGSTGRAVPFGPPFLNAAETRTFVPQLSTVCTVPNFRHRQSRRGRRQRPLLLPGDPMPEAPSGSLADNLDLVH